MYDEAEVDLVYLPPYSLDLSLIKESVVARFPGWGLNRSNPRSCLKLTLIAYLGLAPAGRTQALIISRRAPRLSSFFILVILVIIAESNLILHAPQHYNEYPPSFAPIE
jgi:hypothetical protein